MATPETPNAFGRIDLRAAPRDGRAVTSAAASLAERWRAEAATLRKRGAAVQAGVLDACAAELEATVIEADLEALSIRAAAAESGFSASQLRRLVRAGVLPHVEGRGPLRVPRGSLPRKLRAAPDKAVPPASQALQPPAHLPTFPYVRLGASHHTGRTA